jgi:hypothetical protein
MTHEGLIRMFAVPGWGAGICDGCGATVEWFQNIEGWRFPMKAGAQVRRFERDATTGRTILFFAAADAHAAECPAYAALFKRGHD